MNKYDYHRNLGIIVYPSAASEEVQKFIAHCLEMDIIADADTVEDAVLLLLELIETSFDAAQKHDADPFRHAPDEYWKKLVKAQDLAPEMMERIIQEAPKRCKYMTEARKQLDIRCG